MPQILIDNKNKTISVPILLTAVSGKIRIKNRTILNDYGLPVATKRDVFRSSNYVEWQIGYDVVKQDTDKLAQSSLPETEFIGANGKTKALYELSEYIYYFYKWGVLTNNDLDEVEDCIKAVSDEDLIDNNSQLRISRDHLTEKIINDFKFEYTLVKYPLLIYKFDQYEIVSEIKITEKQRAIGVMPMLYLCFSIFELRAESGLIGRVARTKEVAYFDVTEDNIRVFLELLKMFGILSLAHKYDILEIIKTIKNTSI